MALKHRIEKLEKRGGRNVPPFIVFIKGQKTEAEAIAEWEGRQRAQYPDASPYQAANGIVSSRPLN